MSRTKAAIISIFIFITAIGVQIQAAMPEKEWTFLVYINGHNNLSFFSDRNIMGMERIGSTKDLNMVVEWGSESQVTRRLYVEKSTNAKRVTSRVLQERMNHDMGNYKNLQEFLEWGVKNYPARHYFVAIWNHGSGWHGPEMINRKIVNPMDISFDDHFGTFISTEEVGMVMDNMKKIIGRNIDIYGSDACLMQMIEVAGEMKDSVDYVVGSQDLEPGEGWPYYSFVSKWAQNPKMTPVEVSKLLSKEYYDAYHGGEYGSTIHGITFSVLDISKMDAMYKAIARLSQNLVQLSPIEIQKINKALLSTTHFTYEDYADLGDLMKQIKYLNLPTINPKLLDNVSVLIKDLVVVSNHNEEDYPNATGVSIWAPEYINTHQSRYDNLLFSKATGWNKFTRLLAIKENPKAAVIK